MRMEPSTGLYRISCSGGMWREGRWKLSATKGNEATFVDVDSGNLLTVDLYDTRIMYDMIQAGNVISPPHSIATIDYENNVVLDRVCINYDKTYPDMSFAEQDELKYMAKMWGKAWSEELQTH